MIFADDTVLVAEPPEELESMLTGIHLASKPVCLGMDLSKTKVMLNENATTSTLVVDGILVPLFCASMFDDICSSVVHSLPDSPFSLMTLLTLSNRLLLGLPLFHLPCAYISIVILPTQCSSLLIICPYQFRILSWTSIAISPTFGASIPYSFIPYPVELCNFVYPS